MASPARHRVMTEADYRVAMRKAVRAGLAAAETAFDGKAQQLSIPLALAVGHLEAVSDLQLRELANDIAAEQRRRAGETT
jgi:hypothetical protein